MANFQQICKQLTLGVKRVRRDSQENEIKNTETLRMRILPETTIAKKPRQSNVEAEPSNDVQILSGAKLSFENTNRKARSSNKVFTEEDVKRMQKEQIQRIRKVNRIFTWGDNVPDPLINFSDLSLPHQLLVNLKELNISEPSPIQMQSISIMMEKRNLLSSAPTGSGKTLAFSLPILLSYLQLREKWQLLKKDEMDWLFAIVLEPTRVLAKQAFQHFEQLSNGLPIKCGLLENGLEEDCNILVTTPNKLIYALESIGDVKRKKLLKKLRWLIVDESDRLFDTIEGDKSFYVQLEKIVNFCDGERTRRAFFSATFSYKVEKWCAKQIPDIVMLCIGLRNSANAAVEQQLVFTGWEQGKVMAIRTLLQLGFDPPALVFVQSKERAKQLLVELTTNFKSMAIAMISSEVPTTDCDEIIKSLRENRLQVLICTEVMSRGLDFANVNLVINFDLPTSIVSYIHRIGRTGRAGRSGKAITYFTQKDMEFVRPIATVIHQAGFAVPEYLLHLKKVSKKERKRLQKSAPKRKRIATDPKWKRYVKPSMRKARKTCKNSKTSTKDKKQNKTVKA